MALRNDQELQEARRALFEAFPRSPTPDDLLSFQRRLVHELLATEGERKQSGGEELREHIRMVRLYGDALAFQALSVYALRQLARNSGKPPSLSGQGPGFELALECCEVVNSQGVPALLADVTNVLKNGDLVLCVDSDAPQIVECKLSAVKDIRFERQGRRGRQRARIESIQNFLLSGKGRFFGDDRDRQTVELSTTPRYNYHIVDGIIVRALNHQPSVSQTSEFELYSAALNGEQADSEPAIRAWGVTFGERLAIGGSSDPLRGAWPDIRPPLLWDLSDAARWALMEGDVGLVHVVRVDAFLGQRRGAVHVQRTIETSGLFPWSYEVIVDGEPLVVGPNMLLEVLYAHETIETASQRLLELAQKASAILTAPSNQRMEPTRH